LIFVYVQAKKAGGAGGTKEAEQAEALLLTNKPIIDLTSILTQLVSCPCYDPFLFHNFFFFFQLTHEDADASELALKCLSLLAQLFGGEHRDAFTHQNMVHMYANQISTDN
jgi:hypothetical protein